MSNYPRARMAAAVAVAFVCGLVFTSGFDLTKFSWAQSHVGTVGTTVGSASAPVLGDVQNGFEAVVNKVKPAVVTIRVEKFGADPVDAPQVAQQPRGRRRGNGGGGGGAGAVPDSQAGGQGLPPDIQDFLKRFGQQGSEAPPADDEPMSGAGSGFIVSKDGYILTNNHVVADVDKVTVILVDHRTFEAKVIGRDPNTDVAVIKIDADNLPTVTMGDDASAHVGQWALAIGNPLNLDFTVTAGIVSAKGRNISAASGNGPNYNISDYIQTDAAINPGNSGGPLVNVQGQVIGINSAIESGTGYYTGYGFAIPITLAEEVMNDLIKYGKVRRAVIGVGINEVTPEMAEAAGLKTIGGASVGWYSPDADNPTTSPAGRAGIKQGDVIISAAGKPVDQVSTLQRIIRGYTPGSTVDVTVMRFGQEKTFKITLGEQPSEPVNTAPTKTSPHAEPVSNAIETSYDRLGITLATVAAEASKFRGSPPAEFKDGLVVAAVSPRGPSAHTLAEGEIITKELSPTARDIKSKADFEAALAGVKPGGVITVVIAAPGAGGWQTVPLALRVK